MANSVNISESGTITIGKNITVNRFGYGAMRLTGEGIWGQPKDKAECLRVLKRVVELGINFIDTADSYGPYVSEELIGEALHPYADDLIIATKGGFERTGPNKWVMNGHPDHLKQVLEGSLKRLKLERIDLYQLHRIDPKVPMAETLGFLKDMQDKGLIRHLGLSEVGVEDIEKAGKYIEVTSVQNQYNMVNRQWEDVVKWCEKNDVVFIPWFPLSAGKLESQHVIDAIAKDHQASAFQIALAWLMHHSDAILPIAGTSSVQHLEENIKAVDIKLSESELSKLSAL